MISFFLYRPYALQDFGMMYAGDDQTYFSYASSIAFFQFPSFKKEIVHSPKHYIGSGILAAPFVFMFSLIDRGLDSGIVQERNLKNVTDSWTLFGFVFASIFYFWFSCILLFKALRYQFNENYSVFAVFLMVVAQGIPLYVFRRPIFSHGYEFFLQSLSLFLFFRMHCHEKEISHKILMYVVTGLIAGMMCLVRFNNSLVAAVWILVFWGYQNERFHFRAAWRDILSVYLLLSLPIIIFMVIPETYNGEGLLLHNLHRAWGYISNTWMYVKRALDMNRYIHILFGSDWGLMFTAPFLIIATASMFYFRNRFRNALIVMFFPVAINFFYFGVTSNTHGSWYGYRYFLFTAVPVLLFPMAKLVSHFGEKSNKLMYIFLSLMAIPPLASMLCFEGNPDNLTLHVSDAWGGWKNPTYQLEVWKTLLFNPIEFCKVVLKGGPLYGIYLFSIILNISHRLPDIILHKYPHFEWHIMIKSSIIYAAPFVFFSLFKRFQISKSSPLHYQPVH